MKHTLILLILAACGDNWIPAGVDAGADAQAGGRDARWVEEDPLSPPVPDARPSCEDAHSGKGVGHERNCEKHK